MSKLTQNASNFIKANKISKIVIGALLNKNKRDVRHPKDTVYTRYILENGQVFYLTTADSLSLRAHLFTPEWNL